MRPFVLKPLVDIARHEDFQANVESKQVQTAEAWLAQLQRSQPEQVATTHRLDRSIHEMPLVGVVNITPDSCSDGGQSFNPEMAIRRALKLAADGADIVDLGAESTRPGAIAIPPDEEWRRLSPVLKALSGLWNGFPKISIDTRHVEVAEKALEIGVDMINDVSGLADPDMRRLLVSRKESVIIMHHLSLPAIENEFMPDENVIEAIYRWNQQSLRALEQSGFARDRLIIDVGIGFGKNAKQSLQLIQNIRRFYDLGVHVLVGHSRKRFLKLFTQKDYPERDLETLAVSSYLAYQGVDYLRVHDVASHRRLLRVSNTLFVNV